MNNFPNIDFIKYLLSNRFLSVALFYFLQMQSLSFSFMKNTITYTHPHRKNVGFKPYAFAMLFFVFLFSCNNNNKKIVASNSTPISHEIWNELLQKYVVDGQVNYKGFAENKVRFDEYLNLLNTHHPNDKNWSKNEQLAYWINAYNAYTVELIVDNYPVESIKDLKKGVLSSVWDIEFAAHTFCDSLCVDFLSESLE